MMDLEALKRKAWDRAREIDPTALESGEWSWGFDDAVRELLGAGVRSKMHDAARDAILEQIDKLGIERVLQSMRACSELSQISPGLHPLTGLAATFAVYAVDAALGEAPPDVSPTEEPNPA